MLLFASWDFPNWVFDMSTVHAINVFLLENTPNSVISVWLYTKIVVPLLYFYWGFIAWKNHYCGMKRMVLGKNITLFLSQKSAQHLLVLWELVSRENFLGTSRSVFSGWRDCLVKSNLLLLQWTWAQFQTPTFIHNPSSRGFNWHTCSEHTCMWTKHSHSQSKIKVKKCFLRPATNICGVFSKNLTISYLSCVGQMSKCHNMLFWRPQGTW